MMGKEESKVIYVFLNVSVSAFFIKKLYLTSKRVHTLCQLRAFLIKPPLLLLLLLLFLHGNEAPFMNKKTFEAPTYITVKFIYAGKRALYLILHRTNETREGGFKSGGGKINYRLAHLSHTHFTPSRFCFCFFFCCSECFAAIFFLNFQAIYGLKSELAGLLLMPVASENEFLLASETHSMLVLHFYSFDVEHEN